MVIALFILNYITNLIHLQSLIEHKDNNSSKNHFVKHTKNGN